MHRPGVQGKAGNAAQYMTRTQAVRKLQLRLSEFRCGNEGGGRNISMAFALSRRDVLGMIGEEPHL